MKKFIFTADIHLKDWTDKEYMDDGTPRKLQEILDAFESMCEYATSNGIDTIVIGGDVNDTKNVASVNGFIKLQNLMTRYDKIRFMITHGNHDLVGNIKESSSIQLLNGPTNIETYVDPYIEDNVVFLPYSHHVLDMIQDVYENHDDVKIMIGHLGLSEATLSSGISLRTSIQASAFTGFKLVLLGHYHKPQHLQQGDTDIYYVGSPIPLRRDEWQEEKRFLVVDPETYEVESIPIEGYRKYYQFVLDEDCNMDIVLKEIEERRSQGHHVIVRNKLAVIPDNITQYAGDVKIVNEYQEEYQIRGINSNMELSVQLKKYLEYKQIAPGDHSKYIDVILGAISDSVTEIKDS